MSLVVADATERQRFEATLDDTLVGVLTYAVTDGRIDLIHTKVFPEYEGHGIAAGLTRFALDDARRRGLGVIASCPYVRRYLESHPDDLDIVVGTRRVNRVPDDRSPHERSSPSRGTANRRGTSTSVRAEVRPTRSGQMPAT